MTKEEAKEILEEVKVIDDSIYQYNTKYLEALEMAIKALEQEPKTKWIPVSERLPEKNVWVLVTVEQGGNRHQEIMRRNKYIEAWTDNIDNYTDEITAWMPLPKPYKEG